jgi:hypothetical protein
MGSKLDKFLISLSGIMMVALGVMGLKFQKESADIKMLQENLKGGLASADKVRAMIDIQKELEAKRMENLQKADTAKIGTKTQTSTQTVVIPGKTVTQTTTAKSSSSSSKTTKSS